MAKQAINVGTAANDKKGDSLRAAFQKVNANFTELYEAVGLATTGQDTALTFLGSTLSTDDSSSIVIDRATTVTSNLSVGGDLLPQTANGGDLGSSTLPWRSLYVSNNTIYIGGTAVGVDANGNLLVGGQAVADVGTAAWNSITGKPTFATVATSGAYSDLTGRPTSFNSLVTGAYSVNLESGGVLRANVQGIVSDNQLAVEGSTLISIQTLDGPYLQLFNQGATKEINLVLYDGESLNPTWTFDTDRTLTLPNDSSIKSATNIDITVDTPDSSTFNWRFGADGKLTFPDGTNYAGKDITLPRTTNGVANKVSWNFSDIMVGNSTTFLEWNLLSTDLSEFLIGTSSAATPFYFSFDGSGQTLGTIDNGGIFGGGKLTFGSTAGNNAGDANAIELKATNGDVYLTSTESVKITVDANDSSARVWTFDPSGKLTFPDNTTYSGGSDITLPLDTSLIVNLVESFGPAPGTSSTTFKVNSQSIKLPTTNGTIFSGTEVAANEWGLDSLNKHFNFPNNDLIRYDGADYGLELFTYTKSVNITSGQTQTWKFGTDGRTIFPNGTVPAHSYGAAGDKEGMVVFTDPYIYYCKQDYVNNSTDIWVRVAWTGTSW